MSKSKAKHLIVLHPNYLKAMLLTAAKEDIRYYLTGVCFKAVNGKVWALATDGHRIGRWLVVDDYLGEDFEWIVARNVIEQAIEWEAKILLEAENGALSIGGKSYNTSLCEIIDGLYPNALEVINKCLATPSDETAIPQFQAGYIKDLAKITKLLSKKKTNPPRFTHVTRNIKGGNVFIIDGVPDYLHIIMPLGDIIDKEDKQKLEAIQRQALTPADLTNPIHKLIDEGKFVRCGVSNKTASIAYKNADGACVRMIVAYDKTGYMDDHCEVWEFAHLVEVVEDEEPCLD